MDDKIRVLVVGMGNMGVAHAKAYHYLDDFEIVGLCSCNLRDHHGLPPPLCTYPLFDDYRQALAVLKPDAVSISTWPDTHADYALQAFAAGAHVFLEKPLAQTVEQAEQVIACAHAGGRKLVVGYILRHHPAWMRLVELARTLGKPLVMRMNLNKQSSGSAWQVHKQLMNSVSPLVDCGVHYVDMMGLMSRARPLRVHAVGARLSDEIAADMYNYGQLQVQFDDGSIGWFEAGWGPMISTTAVFIKDVIGPHGCVSLSMHDNSGAGSTATTIRRHHAGLNADAAFIQTDEIFTVADEPDQDDLCRREQQYFARAIRRDLDLDSHMSDAINSLKIVLAADRSVRQGGVVEL
jgi:predicted dehydrogenase